MFFALLLFALVALLFGLFTAVKWLIIVAIVLAVLSLISGFTGGWGYNRRL